MKTSAFLSGTNNASLKVDGLCDNLLSCQRCRHHHVYDPAGQVISMSTNKVDSSTGAMTTVIDEKYTYDANENRTEILYQNGTKETYL